MKKNLFMRLLLLFCASGVFVSCGDDDEKTTVGYSGKDISGDVELVRDQETKKAVLKVSSDKAWELLFRFYGRRYRSEYTCDE